MDRFEIVVVHDPNCGDYYCNGHHSHKELIDHKTGRRKEIYILQEEAMPAIVETLNWLEETEAAPPDGPANDDRGT